MQKDENRKWIDERRKEKTGSRKRKEEEKKKEERRSSTAGSGVGGRRDFARSLPGELARRAG